MTNTPTEPSKQVVHIPFLKHRQFVGRRAELEILQRRIITARDCQRLAVFGPAGMGKTQLVLSFAYSVAEQHPETSVFWMPAFSVEAFERANEKIAQQLGIRLDADHDVKDLLKRHLSASSAGRWLLIVDNADDTDILEPSTCSDGLLRCLPESSLGVTIFTTRSSAFAQRLAGTDLLRLGKPTKNDAAELLAKALVDTDSLHHPTAFTHLLTELGHEPLAITQAAAYINNNEISISEYSRLFRSTGSALSSALDHRKQKAQRRHRRISLPCAYPSADTSNVLDLSPRGHSPSLQSAKNLAALQRIKTCYLLIALGILAVGGSLAVGLFYSLAQDRMGDGFTTAGWMVGVSTLILAAPMAKHYSSCRCWDGNAMPR
jgi:hypothetical protein